MKQSHKLASFLIALLVTAQGYALPNCEEQCVAISDYVKQHNLNPRYFEPFPECVAKCKSVRRAHGIPDSSEGLSEGLSDANRSQCYLRCNSEQDSCNARCSSEADAERAQGGISARAAPCLSSCLQRVQSCQNMCR